MAEKRVEIVDAERTHHDRRRGDRVDRADCRRARDRHRARPRAAAGGLKGIFGGEDAATSVKIELANEQARIELRIAVEYGYPVHSVARGVQENVEVDIEKLAGVAVSSVDVYVKRVVPPQTHDSGSD